jgi:hypothetical protein
VEPLTRGLPPPDPRSLCPLSSTIIVEPLPPCTKFLGTPLSVDVSSKPSSAFYTTNPMHYGQVAILRAICHTVQDIVAAVLGSNRDQTPNVIIIIIIIIIIFINCKSADTRWQWSFYILHIHGL